MRNQCIKGVLDVAIQLIIGYIPYLAIYIRYNLECKTLDEYPAVYALSNNAGDDLEDYIAKHL